MKQFHGGESIPLWARHTSAAHAYPTLNKNIKTDVCIVGGGAAGLLTAYTLLDSGKSVCLLEDFEIASGQSGRSTAQLTALLDWRYFEIEKTHGEVCSIMAAKSHCDAIKRLVEIITREKIDCELEKRNAYLYIEQNDHTENLSHELVALRRAGIEETQSVDRVPFPHHLTGPALMVPDQYQLQPLLFLHGLAEVLIKKGAQVFTRTHVTEIKGGTQAFVKTKSGFTVRCDSIVVATNAPINDRLALQTKLYAYRTYVLAFRAPKGLIPDALYYDMDHPYHYVRTEKSQNENEVYLIVGGEDHRTGQEEDPQSCYDRLEQWARLRFPELGEVAERWSGQITEPVDGLAYIGRNPVDHDNVFVITGHSGNGMTYSMIAADLICDLISKIESPYELLYKPSRLTLRTLGHYLKENLNSAAQYRDWMMETQESDITLPNDEGVVFRKGSQMIAAYRDPEGRLEFHSAVCPHLKGVVRWNSAEKTWDCPCHGSRFTCHGKVIEGPAISNLAQTHQAPPRQPQKKHKKTSTDLPPPGLNPLI